MSQALKKKVSKTRPKKRVKKVVKKVVKKAVKKVTAKKSTTKTPTKRLSKKIASKKKSQKVVEASTRLSIEDISSKMTKTKRKKANILMVENHEHGVRLAWSMLNKWRIRMSPDEVESVVGEALVESALRFDETKGAQFKTFFFYHLRGMLLKEVAFLIKESRETFHIPSEVLENPVQASSSNVSVGGLMQNYHLIDKRDPEHLLIKKQFQKRFWDQCFALDDLEKEVTERHFILDEPLKKIAEDLNYCRCHISRVKSRALKTLKEFVPLILDDEMTKKDLSKAKETALAKKYTGGRGRRK